MEQELFFSGYCRQTDSSRTVMVVVQDSAVLESDCLYPGCPFAAGCPTAQRIGEALK